MILKIVWCDYCEKTSEYELARNGSYDPSIPNWFKVDGVKDFCSKECQDNFKKRVKGEK